MSSNRLIYDSCAYQKSLQQSTSPLDYNLYTGKFENSARCRIEFGVVGGNAVSLYSGNLVDLESDLRGQTRKASLCPSTMYSPDSNTCKSTVPNLPCTTAEYNSKLVHLPSCQIQNFPKVPMPEKVQGGCKY
jgi:hypothetical protein